MKVTNTEDVAHKMWAKDNHHHEQFTSLFYMFLRMYNMDAAALLEIF